MTEYNKRIIINSNITGFQGASKPTAAHHKIMKRYSSPLLGGPPPNDDLLELITHMFNEEEAELAVYLPIFLPRTAVKIARLSGKKPAYVKSILDHLAFSKAIILAFGEPRKYTILPLLPGTFEMTLMTPDPNTKNIWHEKFAQIFERIWETGYMADYKRNSFPFVRYLPVAKATQTIQKAWPSEMLEEILDRYDIFAVGTCQCRLSMQLANKGCDKPLETCTAFGPIAHLVIDRGLMKQVSKKEIISIKKNAEEHGCVTWMMNAMGDPYGDGSCSCCGCCCHALRMVTECNVPGLISKPHFIPQRNLSKCTVCAKCVSICPMFALTRLDNKILFNQSRCIGCGLCVVNCKFNALTLKSTGNSSLPETRYIKLLLKMAPGYLLNTITVLTKRYFRNRQ
ncbi:MAG: 4Fe-4S binding protein [Desulfobacterales bacterium]|nr:4Fe-4S binding protein [Desulfobacterales bacterium]